MPVKPTITLCLCLHAAFLHTATSLADVAPSENQIANIVVSTTRTPQTRELTPLSIDVITRAEIELIGAPHLVDLLRAIGATQVQDSYGEGSRTTVGLRGFGANAAANTLVMIDGRRLNNSDLAPPDLNGIALRDVERVEILQGSSAVLFGDQAVGGVINIITQTPGSPRLELVSEASSYGGRSLQGLLNQPLGDKLDLRVTAGSKRVDGYRDHNALSLSDLRANLSYRSAHGSSFIELQRVRERLELPGALTAEQLRRDRTAAQFPADFADTDTDTARLGTERELSDQLSLLAEWTYRESDARGALSGGTQFSQYRRSQSINPRVQWSGTALLVTAGSDLERTDYRLRSLFGGFPATTRSRQEISSAYVQAIYPVESPVSATVGMRHATMHNEIQDSFSGAVDVRSNADAYEIGLNYRPFDTLRLHLRAAESYRFPKSDELTFTGINTPILDTQRGQSLEAGLAWQPGTVAIHLAGYQLALQDEIGFDPLADIGFGFFGANNNLDATRRTGALLSLKWRATEQVNLAMSFDQLAAEFSEGPFKGLDIPFVSQRRAHVGVSFTPLSALSLYVEAQYTGPRYADGDFANELGRLGGFTVYNAHASYHWDRWTLSLRTDNLADKQYSEYVALRWDGVKTYYPFPERRYHLSLGYQFEG